MEKSILALGLLVFPMAVVDWSVYYIAYKL